MTAAGEQYHAFRMPSLQWRTSVLLVFTTLCFACGVCLAQEVGGYPGRASASSGDRFAQALEQQQSDDSRPSHLLLACLLDGTVAALDASTGHTLWSLTTGGALIQTRFSASTTARLERPSGGTAASSGEQADASGRMPGDSLAHNTSLHAERSTASGGTMGSILPGTDGSLYLFRESTGLQRLPYGVREVVTSAPRLSPDGRIISGRKDSIFFRVDSVTGTVQYGHSSKSGSVGVADQGEDGEETDGADSGSDLFVGRSDFRLHIFDGSTGSEFLNLSYAELQLQVFEKSKGHVEETEESIATDEEIAALGLSLSGSLLSRRAAPLWAGAAAGSSAAASVAPGQAFEDAHRSQDTDKQRNKHAWNADLGAPIMALYDLRSGGCDGHVCRADPRSAAGGARRSTCAGERCQLKNVNQSPVLRKLPIKTISEVDMDEIVLEAGGDEGTWAPQTKRQRKKKSLFRRLLDRLGSRACGNERHSCARSRSSSLMRAVALQNGYADSEEGDIVYIGKTVLGDLYVDQAQAFQRVLRGEMPLSVSDRTAKALRHSPEVGVHVGRRYTATYALPLPTSHGGSSARSLGARTSPASPKSSASVPEAQDGADGTRASMGEFFSGRGADEGGAIHDVPEPALASFLSYKMTSLVAERPWLVLIAGAFVFFFVRLLTTVWSQNTVQIVVAETDAGKAAVEPEATPAAAGSQGVQANAGALVASEAANRAVPLRERGVAQSAADDEVEASASSAENVELLLDLPRGSSAPAAIPGGSENQVRVLPEQVISDSVAADAAPSSPSASDVSVSPRPASAPANVEGLGRSRGPSTDSAPSRASESGDEQVSRSRFDEDFEEVGVLGKGAFGRVVIARNRLDGAEYAVKKIPVLSSLLSQQRRERMLREVTALAKLDHANIVRYYQAWIEDKPLEQDYEWIFGSSGSLYAGSGHKGELDDSAVSDVFGGALDSGLPGGLLEETGSALSTRDGSLLHPGGSMPASPSGSLASRRGGQGAGFARRRGAGAHRDSGESLFAREDAVESGGAESPWSLRETPSPASEEGLRHDLQHLELASRLEQLGTALKPSVCTPQGSASCGSPCSEGLDGDGAASPSSSSSSSGDSTNSVPFSITDDGESSSIAFGATADSAGTASSRSQDRPEVFMLYIQMQLCGGGTLKEFLSRRAHEERGVDTAEALRVFAQIAEGVAYIHSHGLIHRDLKPSNILFSSEDVVKLGDFGLSKRADTQRTPDGTLDGRLGSGRTPAKSEPANLALKEAARWDGSASRRGKSGTRGIGTPLYAAPELEAGHPIPAEWQDRADVYSLGILLFELFSDFGTDMERIRSVSQLRRGILPASFRKTYPRESKLILSMCALRPENRPDAGTVVQSEALRPHYMSQALLSRAPSAISGGGDDSSSQPSYIFVAVQATNSPSVYPDITSVLVDAKRRIAASNTYVDGDTVRLEFSLVADDEDASSSLGGKEGGGANQSSKAVWESIRKRLHRVAGVMSAEVHA